MRAWYIHLSIAKRINELLKMESNSFYIGNIIGVNDRNMSKRATHFQKTFIVNGAKIMLPSYEDYLKKYKDKLNNPVYMGYLVYLMTDYYFNNNTYTNYFIVENKVIVASKLNNGNILYGNMASRRRLKENDYEVLDRYIKKIGGYGIPTYTEEMYDNLKHFKIIHLEKDDVFALIETINIPLENKLRDKIFRKKYKLYTKEEMENTFEGCIKFITDYLKDNILIEDVN